MTTGVRARGDAARAGREEGHRAVQEHLHGCKGKAFSIVQVKALWGPRESSWTTHLEVADV